MSDVLKEFDAARQRVVALLEEIARLEAELAEARKQLASMA